MTTIPFHVPALDERDMERVVDVLRSGLIATGPRTAEFEAAFAANLGSDVHCVAVSSGTAALHLALDAINVRPGDLVMTTPLTHPATAAAIRYLDADPVFVDVDEATGNLTPLAVERVLMSMADARRSRVRAVMPVHYAGRPAASEAFEAVASTYDLRVVEDAAHAFSASRAGQPIGTFGSVTAFSFCATSILGIGEGGMAVTADGRLAHRMRVMRAHGNDPSGADRNRHVPYEVVAPGFHYDLPEMAAALGLSQLERVDSRRERLEEIAAAYRGALAEVGGLRLPPPVDPGDRHAWHLFPVRVVGRGELRGAFIDALAEAGIATSVHFVPLHRQPYYRDRYGLVPADFPAATAWGEQEVSLPIFPAMRDDQVARVIEAVPTALDVARRAIS
jgi:dTDP-4-amino-4,6-dideoxygalactose transaminase